MKFSPKLARIARRTLVTLAALATLVALTIAVENWRGDRAWRRVAADYATRGDPLEVLPMPSVLLAERNFIKTPLLERLLFVKSDQPEVKVFLEQAPVPSQNNYDWRFGRVFGLDKFVTTQRKNRAVRHLSETATADTPAADAIMLLQPMEGALQELRRAAETRPESELVRPEPIKRSAPFSATIPTFQVARSLMIALTAHACAALTMGDGDAAYGDTRAVLRLSHGFTAMPDSFLVDAMIGTVCTNMALQPVWEGSRRHAWNDAQLASLQAELDRLSPLAALERSLRTERAGYVLTLEAATARELARQMTKQQRDWSWRALFFLPRGWLQQNKRYGVEVMQPAIDAVAARGTPEFLAKIAARDRKTEEFENGFQFNPSTLFARMAIPAWKKVTLNAAAAEAGVRLAQTACALERHRLAHGAYPETLAELVPAFLPAVPRDVIDGQPLRYRRLADGTFKLYSIGMDGKDDDGMPADAKSNDNRAPGDWVWPQLAK